MNNNEEAFYKDVSSAYEVVREFSKKFGRNGDVGQNHQFFFVALFCPSNSYLGRPQNFLHQLRCIQRNFHVAMLTVFIVDTNVLMTPIILVEQK